MLFVEQSIYTIQLYSFLLHQPSCWCRMIKFCQIIIRRKSEFLLIENFKFWIEDTTVMWGVTWNISLSAATLSFLFLKTETKVNWGWWRWSPWSADSVSLLQQSIILIFTQTFINSNKQLITLLGTFQMGLYLHCCIFAGQNLHPNY